MCVTRSAFAPIYHLLSRGKSPSTAISLVSCLALFWNTATSQTVNEGSEQAQHTTTRPEKAQASPLLKSIEHLACSDTPGSAIAVLEHLHQNRLPGWGLPNEWYGQHRPPALWAGTFDLLLNELVTTAQRYPDLQYSVENLMLSWNYCQIQNDSAFFDLTEGADKNNPEKTLAHSEAPAQWRGFHSLGFKPDPPYTTQNQQFIERYVPLALTRRAQTRRFREKRFWQLYTTQCFPHPDTGSLYYRKMPFGPTTVKGEQAEIAQADAYPFNWQTACNAPNNYQDLAAVENQPATAHPQNNETSNVESNSTTSASEISAENTQATNTGENPPAPTNQSENPQSSLAQADTTENTNAPQKQVANPIPDAFAELDAIKNFVPLEENKKRKDRYLLINGRAKRLSPIKLQWLNSIRTKKAPVKNADRQTPNSSDTLQTAEQQTASGETAKAQEDTTENLTIYEQLEKKIAALRKDNKLDTEKPVISIAKTQEAAAKTATPTATPTATETVAPKTAAITTSESVANSVVTKAHRTIVFTLEQTASGALQFLVRDSFMGGEPVVLDTTSPLSPAELAAAHANTKQGGETHHSQISLSALRTIVFTEHQTASGEAQFLVRDSFIGDQAVALDTSQALSQTELATIYPEALRRKVIPSNSSSPKRAQATEIPREQGSRILATDTPSAPASEPDTANFALARKALQQRVHLSKLDRTGINASAPEISLSSLGISASTANTTDIANTEAILAESYSPATEEESDKQLPQAKPLDPGDFALARKALQQRVHLSKLDRTAINANSPAISLSALGWLVDTSNTKPSTPENYSPGSGDKPGQPLPNNNALNPVNFARARKALLSRVYLSKLDREAINAASPVISLSAFGDLASAANSRIISPEVYYTTGQDERGKQLLTRARMWHVILSRSRSKKRHNRSWATAIRYQVPVDLSPAAKMARRRHTVRIIGETAYANLNIDSDFNVSADIIAANTTQGRRRKIVPADNNLYSIETLWPGVPDEPVVGSALEESTRASPPIYITTPGTNATGVSPVANVPPHKPSSDSDHFHGFSGTLSLNNTQLEFGSDDNYSITSAVAYKPIKESFFFLRSAVTVNNSDEPINYTWGLGYDDWHPGTWGFELNNWNPLAPGDGLDLENAVGSVTRKFKGSVLENNNLASSLSLNKSANSDFALTWLVSWSPRPNWFIRTLLTQSLEGGGTSWAYGFGYNNYRKNTVSLEYNNWGFNEAFDTNFRRNAIVTLSYKWEW